MDAVDLEGKEVQVFARYAIISDAPKKTRKLGYEKMDEVFKALRDAEVKDGNWTWGNLEKFFDNLEKAFPDDGIGLEYFTLPDKSRNVYGKISEDETLWGKREDGKYVRWLEISVVQGDNEGYYMHIRQVYDSTDTRIGFVKMWDRRIALEIASFLTWKISFDEYDGNKM